MAEQLLVRYKVALPQYVAQTETIGLLITSLYTDVPQLGTTPGECLSSSQHLYSNRTLSNVVTISCVLNHAPSQFVEFLKLILSV